MKIAVYDLNIENASVEKLANGQYEVTAIIKGNTFQFEQDKLVQEQVFSHAVSVAIYAEENSTSKVLVQLNTELIAGKKTISVILNNKPSKIVVDPQLIFIDRNRVDNHAILFE